MFGSNNVKDTAKVLADVIKRGSCKDSFALRYNLRSGTSLLLPEKRNAEPVLGDTLASAGLTARRVKR